MLKPIHHGNPVPDRRLWISPLCRILNSINFQLPSSRPQVLRSLSNPRKPLYPLHQIFKNGPIKPRIQYLLSDPLFDSSRSILTSHWFSSRLCTLLSRIGLSSNYFSPHSFRIGAATSAARAGINQHLIKSMGRWTSSAVELYIRSSSADIATAHQALVSLPRVGGALSARPTRGFLPVGGGFPLHSADGS